MSSPSTLNPPVERNHGLIGTLDPDRMWIRLLRALVGVSLLVALVQKTLDATMPTNDVDIPQLYSEFTIQSNLALGVVLIASAAFPRAALPTWWDHLFGALVFYLVMTGIVYVVLVAPPEEPWWTLDLYWPQMLHHRIAPLFALLDWLVVNRTVRGRWWRPFAWMVYPAAFLAFSWIRGAIDGWYVYDFLDPTLDGGWSAVFVSTGQVLLGFLVVDVLVHVAVNLRVALGRRAEHPGRVDEGRRS